ncbi:adenosine deaminase [Caulobacter sp. BK020]|uniref:adenosine deaminase family protein n=1 Tax=Caulobacter sp. BK020 TaxID=2512117 RepID=UPI0010F3AC78|nr:adenosine deaminase [Caulobacter sp. BK020]TCS12309.1 adenosine deaminase [Caulobacter sp. BK020]
MNGVKRLAGAALGVLLLAGTAQAASPARSLSPEVRTAARFDAVAKNRAQLRLFLRAMPKGGDLHNHLSGAAYAEDFLAWADADGLCVTTSPLPAIVAGPCDAPGKAPARDLGKTDPTLYGRAVNSLSMRNYHPGADGALPSGHDQFFSTFGRFGLAGDGNLPAMLAVVRDYAAGDNVSYVETSVNPSAMSDLVAPVRNTPWDGDMAKALAALEPGLPAMTAKARQEFDAAEAEADRRQGCLAQKPRTGPCAVALGYQAFALRVQPPSVVFAQLAAAFALAQADPRFVGVNIVAPEDDPVALADYALHMRMLQFLHARYPDVKLSPHAGELTLGLVAPRDLRFHIRQAVEVAGARRIGHGVDIAYEDDAQALLARMARDKVAVEINLTSNDVILGVKGADHPLALYRQAGVPFVLSTDDEGVSRIDLTNEYLRAVTEQGLGYADLKAAARASLDYSFLPGPSLWAAPLRPVAACARPGPACDAFLASSRKAAAQWRLEREFEAFEKNF